MSVISAIDVQGGIDFEFGDSRSRGAYKNSCEQWHRELR